VTFYLFFYQLTSVNVTVATTLKVVPLAAVGGTKERITALAAVVT
jgi:hypothetical protein